MRKIVRDALKKIKELRMEYGPLVKLAEKSEKFKSLVESSPILKPVLDRLKPEALTPEKFDEEFWAKLNALKEGSEVFIFSPYLSWKRIYDYRKAMEEAIKRGVLITVHTLHPDHWSIKNKKKHDSCIKLLEGIKVGENGVNVVLRRNMHEKAVIIRGEENVAYFGSLNVLSKVDMEKGGDYMLKFTHQEIVDALQAFIQTLAQHSEEFISEEQQVNNKFS